MPSLVMGCNQILGFLQMALLFFSCSYRKTSANELNNDSVKIRSWDYQWKMIFNPDPPKQAEEVIFYIRVNQTFHQKHLDMFYSI